jgi:ATP-dependent DNA helicase RecQ
LEVKDVIAVLPTGFGKSLLSHLLPYVMPTKKSNNIVLVVCPLNSIIEDRLNILNNRGIAAIVLVGRSQGTVTEELFPPTGPTQGQINQCVNEEANFHIPSDILNGQCSIVFAHPEALFSKEGRELMVSQVFQDNVVACVIDEAHCVEIW